MISPQQAKDSSSAQIDSRTKTRIITYLVKGDKALEAKARELSQSDDDPLILVDWNLTSLGEFWDKAVAYSVAEDIRLKPPILNGHHPAGQATNQSIRQLQHAILAYVSQITGGKVICNENVGTIGLSCSQIQFANVCFQLSQLKEQPWFQAVLATGARLTGTFATIFIPRPRNTVGICDTVAAGNSLWT